MTRERDLPAIFRSGYVTRYHAHPDLAHIRETLAEHHARVAQILFAIHPCPTLALIEAALHHDAGEAGVGDLPAPFKHAHPAIAKAHARAERDARIKMGCEVDLLPVEAEWLKLADMMAAVMHVNQVRPELLEEDEWKAAEMAIDRLRDRLEGASCDT